MNIFFGWKVWVASVTLKIYLLSSFLYLTLLAILIIFNLKPYSWTFSILIYLSPKFTFTLNISCNNVCLLKLDIRNGCIHKAFLLKSLSVTCLFCIVSYVQAIVFSCYFLTIAPQCLLHWTFSPYSESQYSCKKG